jgi:hypothetical protein
LTEVFVDRHDDLQPNISKPEIIPQICAPQGVPIPLYYASTTTIRLLFLIKLAKAFILGPEQHTIAAYLFLA